MRLIDADALFEEYERTGWYYNVDRDEIAEEILRQMPTIDPESLRPQGAWIPYHEADFGWDEYGVRCSNCKLDVDDDNIDFPMNFCPKCGARMTTKKGDADD